MFDNFVIWFDLKLNFRDNHYSGSTTFRASISIGGGLNRAPAHLWDGHQGTVRKENYSAPSAHVLNDVDQTFCGICMERPKNLAFQCGHMCCVHCSEVLTICHMCRIKIEQKIKLFLWKVFSENNVKKLCNSRRN